MLLGAVVAWAILGPLAHGDGWVSLPGSKQPDDATGWLAWVALPIMLMDSVVCAAYVLCAVLALSSPPSETCEVHLLRHTCAWDPFPHMMDLPTLLPTPVTFPHTLYRGPCTCAWKLSIHS